MGQQCELVIMEPFWMKKKFYDTERFINYIKVSLEFYVTKIRCQKTKIINTYFLPPMVQRDATTLQYLYYFSHTRRQKFKRRIAIKIFFTHQRRKVENSLVYLYVANVKIQFIVALAPRSGYDEYIYKFCCLHRPSV